ncbi:hypothetical protein ACOJUR_12060 [Alicyclobacillus tolerans]|uniref:hypothetical protein n=1 Tax=Alicyclobacillus tolerans TaxID=90970 RepID=UPI003B7A327F
MLKYPKSVPTQQIVLAPLQALISQVPACELFRTFITQVEENWSNWSAGALESILQISRVMANVFDELHNSGTQSIYSSQYLLSLAINARRLAVNAGLAATVTTGTDSLSISQSAQTALSTLIAWDPVQGYQTPSNYAQLATVLMNGVVVAL